MRFFLEKNVVTYIQQHFQFVGVFIELVLQS